MMREGRGSQKGLLYVFYCVLGVVLELPSISLKFFGRDALHLEPAVINVVTAIATSPWCLKPLAGLISDSFPWRGQRRRPYLIAGTAAAAASWLFLGVMPAITWLCTAVMIIGQVATVLSDVVCDSLTVECVHETEDAENRGTLQSTNIMFRFLGATAASLASGSALEFVSPRLMFAVTSIPLIVVCVLAARWEEPPIRDTIYAQMTPDYDGIEITFENEGDSVHRHRISKMTAFRTRLRALSAALHNKRILGPLIFIFFINATPSSGAPVFFFLTEELHFSGYLLSMMSTIRHLAGAGGAWLYRKKFRHVPLKRMFIYTTLTITVLHTFVIILVTDTYKTLGIPALVFVVTDETLDSIVESLALLPMLVLAARLCPDGIEASVYASIISVSNAGGLLSMLGGSILSTAFGITMHDFSGLWKLVLVVSVLMPLPLCLLRLVPSTT